jgi:hypothetical protein
MNIKEAEEDAKYCDIFMGLTELDECISRWEKRLVLDMIPVSLSEFLVFFF